MRCETYSRWMTEAALGSLSAPQFDELRAHAAHCVACARELASASALVNAMDRSMAAIVAGEPSPALVARLRTRIAVESATSSWLGAPRLVFAGIGLALTALLGMILIRGPRHESLRGAEMAGAGPQPVMRPETSLEPAPGRSVVENAVRQPALRAKTNRRNTPLDFEVLVPKGQMAAVLELSAALDARRVDGTDLLALAQRPARELEVKPIEIAPLARLRSDDAERTRTPGDSGRQ